LARPASSAQDNTAGRNRRRQPDRTVRRPRYQGLVGFGYGLRDLLGFERDVITRPGLIALYLGFLLDRLTGLGIDEFAVHAVTSFAIEDVKDYALGRRLVDAAVYSAIGHETSPVLRTPFQFARAAMIVPSRREDACSTLGAPPAFHGIGLGSRRHRRKPQS